VYDYRTEKQHKMIDCDAATAIKKKRDDAQRFSIATTKTDVTPAILSHNSVAQVKTRDKIGSLP